MNYFSDEKEWTWLFKNAIPWKKILPLYQTTYPTVDGFKDEAETIDFYRELLTQTGEWASTKILARAPLLDKHGGGVVKDGDTIVSEHMQAFYNEAAELGAFGIPLPKKFGGLETPVAVGFIALSQIARSCMSSSVHYAFFTSIADMIERFAPHQFHERYIPEIIKGTISGCMCLTEPGCGSDLSKIKTSATKNADGTYSITGNKIFITNGGGGLAFVLAKIKDESGSIKDDLSSISMFFVEKKIDGKNNFKIGKIEEKMGMHGSLTCEVLFEKSQGHLCGEAGHGFKYMLHLMNEARIAVAIQSLGGIEGVLSYANKYAGERVQFNLFLKDLPLMKRNLDDMQTETDAIRCLIVDTISHYDVNARLELKRKHGEKLSVLEENLFKASQIWTRKRTPLVKYYACEKFTEISKQCIQVLGGYGFMQEYPVERYHRDSFGPLIYEGTSQIQALMVLKDTVKLSMKNPKKLITGLITAHPTGQLFSDEWDQMFNRIHYKTKKNLLKLFIKTLKPTDPKKVFYPKHWQGVENISRLMIHAETICQALCYIETLRVLKDHCHIEKDRFDLFKRYSVLVRPRLAALYKDWELRE